MLSDTVLAQMTEDLDRHSDLQFVVEHISEMGLKEKIKIEMFIKYRIFELHIMLGKMPKL